MRKKKLFTLVSIFSLSMMTNVAMAQVSVPVTMGVTFGLGTQNLYFTLVGIVNVLLNFLGLIALIVILIGGFRWMLSGGNEEKVAGARQSIIAGIIGLIIILSAFALIQFVIVNVAN